jgi:hypothetical protein
MILLPSLYREKDKDQVMTTITEMISELLELGTIKPEGEHPNRYMCICGAQFQRLSLRTHLRSKRHIKCMEAKESGDAGSGEERECNICCYSRVHSLNVQCVQTHTVCNVTFRLLTGIRSVRFVVTSSKKKVRIIVFEKKFMKDSVLVIRFGIAFIFISFSRKITRSLCENHSGI